MPRHKQKRVTRGSQRWLQLLVNEQPGAVDRKLRNSLQLGRGNKIEWLSPLAEDEYAEYSDGAFLDRLGIEPKHRQLSDFWPSRGPVWDGLARCGEDLILVEAKAHIPEAASPGSAASPASAEKIKRSLAETKRYVGSKAKHDWSAAFYQYTNRLAHLYFLRVLNKIPAQLVFLYFLNAQDVSGPRRQAEWEGAIHLLEAVLGVRHHRLSPYVGHVFVDVARLQATRWVKNHP